MVEVGMEGEPIDTINIEKVKADNLWTKFKERIGSKQQEHFYMAPNVHEECTLEIIYKGRKSILMFSHDEKLNTIPPDLKEIIFGLSGLTKW